MSFHLVYPKRHEGFKQEDLKGIPNKNNQFSGYYLLAIVHSDGLLPEKYACFTSSELSEIWIERIATISSRNWFTIEDTRKINNDDEFNMVLNFLRTKKILD